MSIDNATPEEWNTLRNSKASIAKNWNRIYDDPDTAPKEHFHCDNDDDNACDVALNCDVTEDDRIGSPNWRDARGVFNTSTHEHNVGESDNALNEHPVFSEEAMVKSYDTVNRPEHYNTGGMECIDAICGMLTHDEYIGYLRGNAMKYMWRFRYKGKPIEDLRKARWYEERMMNYLLEHPSDK